MDKTTSIYFPKWARALYGIIAIILIPWTFDLAQSLPTKHVERHWDALWVGFDVIMLFSIILTLYFIIKKVIWVVVSASAAATLFVIDVWFDTLTARPGKEQKEAIVFGMLEILLAILTYRFVYLVIHNSTADKTLRLTTKK